MIDALKQLFTGVDNQTLDLGRVLWAAGAITFMGTAVYAVWKGQPFAPQDYGIGLGAVLAAGGAALKLKKDTEPK